MMDCDRALGSSRENGEHRGGCSLWDEACAAIPSLGLFLIPPHLLNNCF